MSGSLVLIVLIFVELLIMLFSLMKKSNLKKEKSVIYIFLFIIFTLLCITGIIDFNSSWIMSGLFLGVQVIKGVNFIAKKKSNMEIKKSRLISSTISRCIMLFFLLIPTLIFPHYEEIKPSGKFEIGTVSYSLTDESREEYFTEEDDRRKITIQFWYPSDNTKAVPIDGRYPLIVFSHGAFGYRMSNYSTFQELASNGYIVVSIDHTHHAMFTKQEDGKIVIGNMEFINSAMAAQNGDIDEETTNELGQQWLKLRTEDMEFVINYIKEMGASQNSPSIYKSIDLERIGVAGHSLGGATSAQVGRDNDLVDAVVVIDGTMLGEKTTDTPYPKPILNIYNEEHYKEALSLGEDYPNYYSSKYAIDASEEVFEGADHINFTDLPIASPFLAKLLGIGEINPEYCIKTTNKVILDFFQAKLK